jgi:hypothetical protein
MRRVPLNRLADDRAAVRRSRASPGEHRICVRKALGAIALLQLAQIHQRRKLVVATLRPAVFDPYVLPFDIPGFAEALTKRGYELSIRGRRSAGGWGASSGVTGAWQSRRLIIIAGLPIQ